MEVKLHAFPSRDREFLDFAQAAFNVLAEPRTIEALQRALRVRYPAAVVTQQAELARHGEGPIVWYAFRTAAIGIPPIGAEPDEPEAWAILDDERRFVEVTGLEPNVTHRWSGIGGYTQDGLPIVEEVRPGIWATGGYNGTGNLFGAVCAREVANLALNRANG